MPWLIHAQHCWINLYQCWLCVCVCVWVTHRVVYVSKSFSAELCWYAWFCFYSAPCCITKQWRAADVVPTLELENCSLAEIRISSTFFILKVQGATDRFLMQILKKWRFLWVFIFPLRSFFLCNLLMVYARLGWYSIQFNWIPLLPEHNSTRKLCVLCGSETQNLR